MGIFSDFLANENAIGLINSVLADERIVALMKPNDWERLCRNSVAMHIILALSSNTCSVKYLEENPNIIDYNELSRNHAAMHLVKNMSALPFLTKDYNKYVLGHLMANSAAMDIITKDMSSINYEFLSKNTNSMHLLEDKFINVRNLLANYLMLNSISTSTNPSSTDMSLAQNSYILLSRLGLSSTLPVIIFCG